MLKFVELSDFPDRTIASMIALIAIVVLFLVLYLPKRRLFQMMAKIPGPDYRFPFGTLSLVWNNSYINDYNKFEPVVTGLAEIYKNQGICKMYMMHNPSVVIFDHKLSEDFLKDNANLAKPYEYQILSNWLGKGLLLNDDSDLWKNRRKLLTPAFHFKILEEFVPTINENADILVNKLRNHVGRGTFDIMPYLFSCTLDVICETSMGKRLNCQSGGNREYFRSVHRLSEVFAERLIKPWLLPNLLFYLTAMGRETKRNIDFIHEFARKVIYERKQSLIRTENTMNEEKPRKRLAFLDLLLDLHLKDKSLTLEDIREEVDTTMFAGHDTTAVCLSWTFFLLGHHPEVQQKALEELDSIVGDSSEINVEQLKQMTYLEAIIKESLRLYPPVPMIARKISQDLKLGDYTAPSGCSLYLSILALHKDPKIFSEPLLFRPERFLDHRRESPFVFTPFSAGARSCIGQKFAMNELKVILTKVLLNYNIRSLEDRSDIVMTNVIVSRPLNGIRIELTNRSHR